MSNIPRPARVLVIEDQKIIRDRIAKLFAGQGCHVEKLHDHHHVNELLARKSFDLIITDNDTDEAEGAEGELWSKAYKEHPEAVPVILFTSALPEDRTDIAMVLKERSSADFVVSKTQIDVLYAAARMLLESHHEVTPLALKPLALYPKAATNAAHLNELTGRE